MSKALTDTYCRKGDLSVDDELAGFCGACGGAGFVVGSIDYPGFDSRRWCPQCDTGRRLIGRIAEIVARARAEDRSRTDAYRL